MVAFHHTLDDQLVFAFFTVEGTWFPIQLDGLGDGRDRVRDSLNFDCSVFDIHRKCCNYGISFDGARDVGEERINFEDIGVVTPKIPVFLAIFGSLCNQAICN